MLPSRSASKTANAEPPVAATRIAETTSAPTTDETYIRAVRNPPLMR